MLKKRKSTFFASLFLGTALTFSALSLVQAEGDGKPLDGAGGVSWSVAGAKVKVVNNAGKPSTVTVTGLPAGALVEVYDKQSDGKVIGKGTVRKGAQEVVISIRDLGEKEGEGGQVFVSVTLESSIVPVDFIKKQESTKPDVKNITIKNNVKASDTVEVKGPELVVGDTVKVYYNKVNSQTQEPLKTDFSTIATAKVTKKGDELSAIVSIPQLGYLDGKGNVLVSVTSDGKKESPKTEKPFEAEKQTAPPNEATIHVQNNYKMSDTVEVPGLAVGDIVKVYYNTWDATNEKFTDKVATATGTAKAAKDGTISAIVSIAQLGPKGSLINQIKVTVTSKGERESNPTEKAFEAEKQSDKPTILSSTYDSTNKKGSLEVSGTPGDIIKVYIGDKAPTSTTVSTGKTSATITLTSLATKDTPIAVTATSKGKFESGKTPVTFP